MADAVQHEEWYRRHRPRTLKEVVGQPQAQAVLKPFFKTGQMPHVFLFTGPSGTGKTTLAQVVARKVGTSEVDFKFLNAADFRGIDMVRGLREHAATYPMAGRTKTFLLDEAHQISRDGQEALLNLLEHPPRHVWYVLATTDPEKLLDTLVSRCTRVHLQKVPDKDLEALVRRLAAVEKVDLTDDVVERIVEVADGSARVAVVSLQTVAGIPDEDARLDALLRTDTKKVGLDLARALMDPKQGWGNVASLLKGMGKDIDQEKVRHQVLGYAGNCLLSGKGPTVARAAAVLDVFQYDFYQSKRPGLFLAAYKVCNGG